MGVSGVHGGLTRDSRVAGHIAWRAPVGRHPGGRPGGGSPSPARRRRRSCSSPWRGRRSPEAAPGAQLRPGAPRHASRRAPGEGAAWLCTAWRRRQHGRLWALRRRRGSGRAPATSPGGGGGGCAALARLLQLQLLPSGKGRAAAAVAPPLVPRLPPPGPSPSPAPSPGPTPPQRRARLPSDSPPPVQRGAAPAAVLQRPKRGRALPRASESARCRTYLAVAPRQIARSVGAPGAERPRARKALCRNGAGCFRSRETGEHAESCAVPTERAARGP